MPSGLFLNYMLEFAMVVPAAVLALMPVRGHERRPLGFVYLCATILSVVAICVGAAACFALGIASGLAVILIAAVLFVPYCLAFDMSVPKLLACYLGAVFLCAFCVMYTNYVTAPWEVDNDLPVFTWSSGLVCLGIAAVTCLVFAKTLLVKLPSLLGNENLDRAWKWLVVAELVLVVAMFWMTPVYASVVMTGRVRQVGLVLTLFAPTIMWLLCHMAWRIAQLLLEGEQLKRERTIAEIEQKRSKELLSYIDDARMIRHDFRHHMAVIGELANAHDSQGVAAYVMQLEERAGAPGYQRICENPAVDAIASHYGKVADENGVEVSWALVLPQTLPVNEIDYCSILGNLVENAIRAACAQKERKVRVASEVFSGYIVSLVVENTFNGEFDGATAGLQPKLDERHGIGLASVDATVKKYDGSFEISASDGTFCASVLLYGSNGM